MSDKRFIKECLLMLDAVGCNPLHQNRWTKFKAVVVIAFIAHLLVEFILQFALNWNGFETSEPWMLCLAFLQTIYKLLGITKNGRKVKQFVKNLEKFWPWKDVDLRIKSEINSLSQVGWSVGKFLIISCALCIVVVMLRPLFSKERVLPLDTYHPTDRHDTPLYSLTYFVQIFDSVCAYISVMAFDNFFLACSAYVIFELKIIKHRFENIDVNIDVAGDDERCLQEMSLLVDHHNLVLDCIELIDGIFSGPILIQLSNSVLLLCSTLLGLISDGLPPDLEHVYYFMPFLSVAVIQVFIYCWAGAFVLTESDAIAEAMYASKWWAKTQPKFRRSCVMVIQRSNKAECLTAGGMFVLNLETFAKILRFSLSFLSLAQAMRKDLD